MKNIWVFSTSIESPLEAVRLLPGLDELTGRGGWNIDFDDCDRVLRVVTDHGPEEFVRLLNASGFQCAELPDEVPGERRQEHNRIAS